MGGRKGGGGVNSKVAAANERKAANNAIKAGKERQRIEAEEAKEWSKGSNLRGQHRAEAAMAKADEAARKRREKEALLAAEEEAAGGGGKLKKDVGSGMKSKQSKRNQKHKPKNDLSLLEDSLIAAADRKRRAAKTKTAGPTPRPAVTATTSPGDALLANTAAMIGTADDDDDVVVGRRANVLAGESYGESGLDGALRTLQVSSASPADDAHPEKRVKALHKAFEERLLPEMKRDYPGLKMSQYKEKIFNLWKKSPENPLNQPQPQQASLQKH